MDDERVRCYNAKDTRRWCKGVVGREHHNERLFLPPWDDAKGVYFRGHRWAYLVCGVCGKQSKPESIAVGSALEAQIDAATRATKERG